MKSLNAEITGLTYSPIKGPEGNIEYLLYIKKVPFEIVNDEGNHCADLVEKIVEEANGNL